MNISAVLLAGGESRRMGRDKATLEVNGKPLWQKHLDLLRKIAPTEIFVSARVDPPWRPDGVEFVADVAPSRGPLSGIAATLTRIGTPHLLVLAIDMPFMTADYLRSLCDDIAPGRGVVPMIDNRAEPLAAIYPREAAPEISLALAAGDFSLQTVARALIGVGKLAPLNVAPGERCLFRNLNEPADLAQL